MIRKYLVHLTFADGSGRFDVFATCLNWHAIIATLKQRTGARWVLIVCEVPVISYRATDR